MRRIGHTPIEDDAETAGIRPLEACVSLSTEGSYNHNYKLKKSFVCNHSYHPLPFGMRD